MDGATNEPAERAFAIGVLGNGALALAKLGVGWASGSVALISDGWHSSSDVLVNGAAWAAHRFARTPADADHHFGHGNAESLAAAVVGGLLIAGGVGVAWNGVDAELALAEGSAYLLVLGVALLSISTNLFLAWQSARAARASRSPGLVALARDNGADASSGLLVIAGVVGSHLGHGWAEPAAAVAIGALIVWLGFRSLREGMDVLMDRVADPGLRERLERTAAAVEGVRGVQSTRVHPLGRAAHAEMELSVDADLTVRAGHRIAHAVESAVLAAHDELQSLTVHVNPAPDGTRESG